MACLYIKVVSKSNGNPVREILQSNITNPITNQVANREILRGYCLKSVASKEGLTMIKVHDELLPAFHCSLFLIP